MTTGGPSRFNGVTAAPATPLKREPNTTQKLTRFGPGRNCDSENVSLNSSAVIHLRRSTIIRRAQGSAPPKLDRDTNAKPVKSSVSDGWKAGGVGSASG